MKILILGSKEYPLGTNKSDDPIPSGGMELYIEHLISSMKRYDDLQITIITRRFKGTKSREIHGNVEIIRVPFKKGVLFRNPTFNIRAFLRSLNMDFDVIISNGDIADFLGLILSKIKRKPIIMVCHGIASEQPQYNPLLKLVFRILEKSTYAKADMSITHSPHQIENLTRRYETILPGLDRERLHDINHNAVESIKKQYDIAGKKVILFTGRLVKVKGLEYLIRSLTPVKNDYICFIVGDGPAKAEYQTLSNELGVNVIFTGFRSDIQNFLSLADVFVLPSVGGESLNYSMLEAAYMKVPIVVSDLKILPHDCGMIVPKRDENAIAAAINHIFSNDHLAKERAKNAFEYTKKFNWDETGKKYHEILKRFEK